MLWSVSYLPSFPGGSDSKESVCRRRKFDRWFRKIPWRREWQSTVVFLLEEFHGQRSLAAYNPWGHKESYLPLTMRLLVLLNLIML